MTSLERQEGNIYGVVTEPAYSILTYTWGRWPAPNGPHIDVSGTTWDIPAVNESMFSVATFHQVIKKMGEINDFAWIDVVCIDQENYAVKMDEIGRQVGIFAKADRVYVWLWTQPLVRLQEVFNEIFYRSGYLQTAFDSVPQIEKGAALAPLKQCLDTLFDDWWFTSLWTLQEGILRPDATVLARDAQTVELHDGLPPSSPSWSTSAVKPVVVQMKILSNALFNLRVVLESGFCRFTEPPFSQLGDAIIERIKRAGYSTPPFGFNPNIQWGVARFRNASFEQDRIYGIMSIYNLRIGAAAAVATDLAKPAASPRRYALAELEREFAAALNQASPLLGQLFIHLARPTAATWQISQCITVPAAFCDYDARYTSTCNIAINTTTGNPSWLTSTDPPFCYAKYNGNFCTLRDLSAFWKASVTPKAGLGKTGFYFYAVLDTYVVAEHAPTIPAIPVDLTNESYDDLAQGLAQIQALFQVFGDAGVEVLELGRETNSMAPYIYGLLLHRRQDTKGGPPSCRRIGICKWSASGGFQRDMLCVSEPVSWKWCERDVW
ncbi:hypothetical protein PG994_012746 [Apiospora phragmitis]|uniref:Heterokaryon incompatibility domain-containing protein n=1 Tax=Apiospora phragmitis TaxID=2905665 RepID=A0ABR1TDZ5_9PEZI